MTSLLSGRIATRRVLCAVLIASGTLAGLSSVLAQSETLSGPSAEFEQALSAFDKAWDGSDLAFSTVTFTEGASRGYGQYTPRDSADFADGEVLSIYAEPVGYAFRQTDDGFEYEVTASYKLLNLSGQVLAEQESFATFSGSGRTKQRELAASLTFQFSGLPTGDYRLEALFDDEIGGKQSSFDLPFTITGTN